MDTNKQVNEVLDESIEHIKSQTELVADVKSTETIKHDTSVHIYLASPFFNDEQREKVRLVESIIEKSGNVTLFSPSRDGVVCPPDATNEQRTEAFQSNIVSITKAQLVVAIIDYHTITDADGREWKKSDDGTIFEIGMAFAAQIPIIAVALDDVHKLNLMLSESFSALSRNEDQAIYNIGQFVKFYSQMNERLMEYEVTSKELVVSRETMKGLMEANTHTLQELGKARETYLSELNTLAKPLEEIRKRTLFKGEIE